MIVHELKRQPRVGTKTYEGPMGSPYERLGSRRTKECEQQKLNATADGRQKESHKGHGKRIPKNEEDRSPITD
jgi:hypothetical protein